jgi:hypothetical protein
VDAIKFPILCFSQGIAFVKNDMESLSTCTKAALRYEYFKEFWFIDSSNHKFKIKSAKKLHGVGLLWGYDVFLNQRIRVGLEVEEATPPHVSLEEAKAAVFKSFRKWHGWASADDFDELQAKIKNATSLSEIMDAIDRHRRGLGEVPRD